MTENPIRSVEEFYAHAIAIEREAMERYREFEAYFSDRGEPVLAGLCRNLAQGEHDHYDLLVEAASGLTLPTIHASEYCWLDRSSPEAAPHEFFYRVASPRQLLEIALEAERCARRFFGRVAETSPSQEVRDLALDMVLEEEQHVAWVTQALEYSAGAGVDWERILAGGAGPGLALGAERRLRRSPPPPK